MPTRAWSPAGCGECSSRVWGSWQARHTPWTEHLLQLVGEGCSQTPAMRHPSRVGQQAPSSALPNILKRLVKGRSISHVSLACGIKIQREDTPNSSSLVGTGIPEQWSLRCRSLRRRRAAPSGDVAWCQRPRFKLLSLSTADSQPRDFCKVQKIPKA